MYDVVIIGAGPAGLTAAVYAQRSGMSSLIVESGPPGGYAALAPLLENVPAFPEGISGPDLSARLVEQALHHGATMESDKVCEIKVNGPADFLVKGQSKEYPGRSVIIASGTHYRHLGIKSEVAFLGRGVSYCATCDGMFYKGLKVAIAGGGNSAITEALYLANLAEKVYVVHRRDELRAEEALQQRLFATENCEVIWNSVVKDIQGSDFVEKLILENTKTGEPSELSVDGLFVSIGVLPQVEFLGELVDYAEGDFVVTDELMKTKTPGLYAAGDVRWKELRQVVTACADGAIAATSAHDYLAEHDPRFTKQPDRLRGEE